jgi:hypothetical protein
MNDVQRRLHQLHEGGWTQGALLASTPLTLLTQCRQDTGSWQVSILPVKPADCFVLVTHPCDFVSDQEKTAELLRCSHYEAGTGIYVSASRNSARFFLIDPEQRTVAHAHHRIIIKKLDLEEIDPIQWPSDVRRRSRFVRWLGSRFDRAALPDGLNLCFVDVARRLFDELRAANDPAWARLHGACKEWRINIQERLDPPYEVHLLLVWERDTITAEEANARDAIIEQLRERLDRTQVLLHEDIQSLPPERIPWSLALATTVLPYEFYSYEGDVIDVALPTERT